MSLCYQCLCEWVNVTNVVKRFDRSVDWKSDKENASPVQKHQNNHIRSLFDWVKDQHAQKAKMLVFIAASKDESEAAEHHISKKVHHP